MHDNTGCYNDALNLYTSEARFSHPRWVWLYTCNFLHESEYVAVEDLLAMMNGTHILMGYETQSYLSRAGAEYFASELEDNYIIDAFFASGDMAERFETSSAHVQKVIFISGARYEKIETPPETYSSIEYTIYRNRIQANEDWEL
jgi:hypothetical protein